jgi:hypothetical protein
MAKRAGNCPVVQFLEAMKRIILASTLLTAGFACLLMLRGLANGARQQLESGVAEWRIQTNGLAEIQGKRALLLQRLGELRRNLTQGEVISPGDELAAVLTTNGLGSMSPEVRRRVLADLGLNWHSSSDYVLVSKQALPELSFNVLKNEKLSDTACEVLDITPDQRQQMDAALARTMEEFSAWARVNVQREPPSGDTLAPYTLPADPELAQSLTNALFSSMNAILGKERSRFLQGYAEGEFKRATCYFGTMSSTLAVVRKPNEDGQAALFFEHSVAGGERGNSSESGRLSSNWFPSGFRNIFPGGWEDLAQREHFELPPAK